MRSVLVFMRDTTEAEVAAYLDGTYPSQREPWVVAVDGDPHLYIDLYHDGPREHEPEEWADITCRLGGEPVVGVIANVTGRHPGDKQVAEFVTDLLARFHGGAMDEYTTHLWSLAELRAGRHIEGHPFFDYNGWYVEDEL